MFQNDDGKWEKFYCQRAAWCVPATRQRTQGKIYSIITGLRNAFVLGWQWDGNAKRALFVQHNTSRWTKALFHFFCCHFRPTMKDSLHLNFLSFIRHRENRKARFIVQLLDIKPNIRHAIRFMLGRIRRWLVAGVHCWSLLARSQKSLRIRQFKVRKLAKQQKLIKYLITFLHRTPFFELKALEPGMNYDVVVMAVNKKGKSSPVMIQGYTVKSPEKQTGNHLTRFVTYSSSY